MQHLEVSGAVRPLKWSLGVKWLMGWAGMTSLLPLPSGDVNYVTDQLKYA